MEKYLDLRKRKFCNLHLCKGITYSGNIDMPALIPFNGMIPDKFISFNKVLTSKEYDCGVHFFIDDYQFERIWRQPEKYLPMLKRFQCVIAPDFSLFVDVPAVVNMWNVYRNRIMASWMQQNGVSVIPSASWGNIDTFKYCFDGLPDNSVIAVGHASKGRSDSQRVLWNLGIDELIRKKSPYKLIIYGNACEMAFDNVKFIDDYITKLRKYDRRKKTELSKTLL